MCRLPWYPFAASRTARRFFFALTERFTLAIASRPQEPLDLRALGRDLGHALDTTPAAPGLLREHVVARGLAVQDLPVAGDPEPLRGGAVRLHLRHGSYPSAASSAAEVSVKRLLGAITMIMLRPSCFGIDSTTIRSPRSLTNRSRILRPRSVCAISRPRNMIVTLTLAPIRRNRSTWPFFVL